MSLKHKLYRSVIVGAVAVAIVIATVGAIVFIREPMASADNSVRSISQSMEATVYRDPNCGCCEAWMEYLRSNGFQVSEIQQPNIDTVKQEYNVPVDLRSCHTAVINGAVIEGHVPADDIKRFLSEESNAIGLAVPGMPVGSPGMEVGETQDPFTVFSFDQQRNTEVFNQYSA